MQTLNMNRRIPSSNIEIGDSDSNSSAHGVANPRSIDSSGDYIVSSVTVNITKPNSKVVVTGVIISGNQFSTERTVQITRDATLLSSTVIVGSISASPQFFNVVDSNPPLGNVMYLLESDFSNGHTLSGSGITVQVLE